MKIPKIGDVVIFSLQGNLTQGIITEADFVGGDREHLDNRRAWNYTIQKSSVNKNEVYFVINGGGLIMDDPKIITLS